MSPSRRPFRIQSLAAAVVALLTLAAPSQATEVDPVSTTPVSTTTVSTTTVSTTTPPSSTSAPSTTSETTHPSTAPSTPAPDTTVVPSATDTTISDEECFECEPPLHDIDGDGILDPIDPEIDPGMHEVDTDETPPAVIPSGPANPPPSNWMGNHLVIGSAEDAKARLDAAEVALAETIEMVRGLRLEHKVLVSALHDAIDSEQDAIVVLADAKELMRIKAMVSFVEGEADAVVVMPEYGEVLAVQAQQTMADAVLDVDAARVSELGAALDAATATRERAEQRLARVESAIEASLAEVDVRREEAAQARKEHEVFEAGSNIYIEGLMFPIEWPYSTPLINSWGFPRSGGRSHKGIDIFAPAGTPLIATEDGVVTRIGYGDLGGNRLWLKGSSGTDWYYAHLQGFSAQISEGGFVEKGTVLGYVGNTGNAVGTAPHLHLEIHPAGLGAVNPYPLLKIVSDREMAERHVSIGDLPNPPGG